MERSIRLDLEKQSVVVKAFKYPGPFNYNAPGCCKLPSDTLVAHFKSLKKSYILSACCRDRVFPDKEDVRRESWKSSCDCNQKAANLNTECWMESTTSTEDDGWCDTSKSEEIVEDPFAIEYDNCIVGAGLSGSVIAEQYATKFGQTSLIIEKRNHIGGNVYDYIDDDTGIRCSLYGAHLFHTRHERVWEYVQQFADWIPYEHSVVGNVNGKIVPIPVTIDTVNTLFDLNIQSTQEMDEWLKNEQVQFKDENGNIREPVNSEEVALTQVGQRLYDLIFKPYTYKQWAKYPSELGPEVLSRIPVRNNHDGRYFSDPHQALPKDGFLLGF